MPVGKKPEGRPINPQMNRSCPCNWLGPNLSEQNDKLNDVTRRSKQQKTMTGALALGPRHLGLNWGDSLDPLGN